MALRATLVLVPVLLVLVGCAKQSDTTPPPTTPPVTREPASVTVRPEAPAPSETSETGAGSASQRGSVVTVGGRDVEDLFRSSDRNGDGKLTKDDMPEMAWKRLAVADTNHDGTVTLDEYKAGATKARPTASAGVEPKAKAGAGGH